MKTSQFSFDLPPELIAQTPSPDREAARLLVLDRATGATTDGSVHDLARWIESGTVLVLNDTRVRKARLFGERAGGGRTEIVLLERRGSDSWEALAGRAKRLKPGARLAFPEGVTGIVEDGEADTRLIRFTPAIDDAWLERNGHVPLPPYIRRGDTSVDEERYQTVYSRVMGSAAAPTAGLHFTPRLLEEIRGRGVSVAWVTLHVGLGTFLPIRTEEIEDHAMHEEAYTVPAETKTLVDAAVREGRPVLAVGTTVVRTLESAWSDEGLRSGEGRTRIYITPGYRFRVVRRLFTNFHTPGSSLIVLVSAFAGRELILKTYGEAVRKRYRFFSYGDAMLIR
ncbi:MAG TPA: tRNA preQ1(34) S-adenosylmethionine ribosyltransferase-isomerase QueA [Spirochaetia bacterium]